MDIPRPENKKRKRIRQIAIGSVLPRWRSPSSRSLCRNSSPPRRPSTATRSTPARRAARRDAAASARPGHARAARDPLDRRAVGGPSRARHRAPRRRRRARHDSRGAVESGLDAPGRGSALRARGREGRVRGVRAHAAQPRARPEGGRRAGARRVRSARLQAEAERAAGVVAELTVRRSELQAEQLKATYDIQVERLNQFGATVEAQIAAQRARLAQDAERLRSHARAGRGASRSAPVSPASCN